MGEEWGVGVKRPFREERMTGTRNSGLCSMTGTSTGTAVGWVWDGCMEGGAAGRASHRIQTASLGR